MLFSLSQIGEFKFVDYNPDRYAIEGRTPDVLQVQLLADGLQPLVKELSELFEGVILGGVLFLLLIIHDRKDVAIFGLPLVLVNDMAHHRSHWNFNRTVRFLASDV